MGKMLKKRKRYSSSQKKSFWNGFYTGRSSLKRKRKKSYKPKKSYSRNSKMKSYWNKDRISLSKQNVKYKSWRWKVWSFWGQFFPRADFDWSIKNRFSIYNFEWWEMTFKTRSNKEWFSYKWKRFKSYKKFANYIANTDDVYYFMKGR